MSRELEQAGDAIEWANQRIVELGGRLAQAEADKNALDERLARATSLLTNEQYAKYLSRDAPDAKGDA